MKHRLPTDLAVVDSQNRLVRWTTRAEVHDAQLPHRSVHVMVVDRAGRWILQKRHATKDTYGEYWDIGCAGHVEYSDYPNPQQPNHALQRIYATVAKRELREELGIDAEVAALGQFSPLHGVHYEHFTLFLTIHDGPYVAAPSEIEAIQYFSRETFESLKNSPNARITPSLAYIVEWMDTNQAWP